MCKRMDVWKDADLQIQNITHGAKESSKEAPATHPSSRAQPTGLGPFPSPTHLGGSSSSSSSSSAATSITALRPTPHPRPRLRLRVRLPPRLHAPVARSRSWRIISATTGSVPGCSGAHLWLQPGHPPGKWQGLDEVDHSRRWASQKDVQKMCGRMCVEGCRSIDPL